MTIALWNSRRSHGLASQAKGWWRKGKLSLLRQGNHSSGARDGGSLKRLSKPHQCLEHSTWTVFWGFQISWRMSLISAWVLNHQTLRWLLMLLYDVTAPLYIDSCPMDPGAMAMVSNDLCDRRFRRTWKWSSRHLAPESLVVFWFSGISFLFFFPLLSAVVQSKVWGHDFGGGIQTGRNSGKRSLVAPEDHRNHRNPQRWPKEFQRVLEATALCMASFTRDSELRYYCLLLVMLLFVTMFALNAEMCMLRFAEYRHNRGAEFFDEQSQFQGCLPVVFGICFGLLAFGFSVLCFPVLSF